jgi:hypothetical protein
MAQRLSCFGQKLDLASIRLRQSTEYVMFEDARSWIGIFLQQEANLTPSQRSFGNLLGATKAYRQCLDAYQARTDAASMLIQIRMIINRCQRSGSAIIEINSTSA